MLYYLINNFIYYKPNNFLIFQSNVWKQKNWLKRRRPPPFWSLSLSLSNFILKVWLFKVDKVAKNQLKFKQPPLDTVHSILTIFIQMSYFTSVHLCPIKFISRFILGLNKNGLKPRSRDLQIEWYPIVRFWTTPTKNSDAKY